MRTITLEGVGEVQLRKSARAKRIILKIDGRGVPIVTVPNYTPYVIAERFARRNQRWFAEHFKNQSAITLADGQTIAESTIYFQADPNNKLRSRVTDDKIIIYHPAEMDTSNPKIQEEAKKASTRAIKRQAEIKLPTMLHQLAQLYGYTYKSVSVKNMKTRWGSCSNTGVINLNIWLVVLPDELIKYVLCHELSHLNNPHHQAKFWTELGQMVPNYKAIRAQLKQHAPNLQSIIA